MHFDLTDLTKINSSKLRELAELEMEIYRCGVDGGMLTSEAVERLEYRERQLGVYDSSAGNPRWVCNG